MPKQRDLLGEGTWFNPPPGKCTAGSRPPAPTVSPGHPPSQTGGPSPDGGPLGWSPPLDHLPQPLLLGLAPSLPMWLISTVPQTGSLHPGWSDSSAWTLTPVSSKPWGSQFLLELMNEHLVVDVDLRHSQLHGEAGVRPRPQPDR